MSRYRKIDPRFWRDEKIRELSITEKIITLYAFTGQSNRIGLFNFSPGEAAEDLGISPETFREGFMEPFGNVCRTLNFGWDERARVLYLPTWWKYNCPDNPNVLKACLQDLHEIPQTPLLTEFSRNLRYLPETFHQTFREGFPKPSPQRMPDQEQKQEQDNNKSGASAPNLLSLPQTNEAKDTIRKTKATKRRRSPAAGIPTELQPSVYHVITRINELAGTTYQPDSKIVLRGLVPRLEAGKTEADCIAVVEDRWRNWRDKAEMRQHFNPETIFRESNFEKYLNASRMANNSTQRGFVG